MIAPRTRASASRGQDQRAEQQRAEGGDQGGVGKSAHEREREPALQREIRRRPAEHQGLTVKEKLPCVLCVSVAVACQVTL